ncbi:MAG: hypothetical protein WC626_12810 [Methanoregula sp.]
MQKRTGLVRNGGKPGSTISLVDDRYFGAFQQNKKKLLFSSGSFARSMGRIFLVRMVIGSRLGCRVV